MTMNLAVAGALDLGVVVHSRELDWNGAAVGILFGAFSLGATLGALSLNWWHPQRPISSGYLTCAVGGAGLLAFAQAPTLATAAAALSLSGLGFGPSGGLLLGSVQRECPPRYLGRVMSLLTLTSVGATPLGLLLFGALVSGTSNNIALLVCGATIITVAAIATPTTRGELSKSSTSAAATATAPPRPDPSLPDHGSAHTPTS